MNIRFLIIVCLSLAPVYALKAQQQLSQSKSERLFAKGKELIDHANFGAARKVFSDFLESASPTDSRRGEAQYYIGLSALKLNHADGEKLIDNFITDNPSTPRASTAYYDLAIFFYKDKNYTKSINYFKKVDFPALTNEQQSNGHFSWGYSAFNLKKLDEALEQFNFVKSQSNAYAPAASYYAGFIEYSKGMYTEALADLKRAESSAAYASIVPYLVANIYYKQKKYNELIQYAESIKSRTDITNSKEISMLVADAHYFKGDYAKAVESYEQYFTSNENKGQSALLFRAGYAHYALGQDDKAAIYLKNSAAASDSISYYASYYLGIVYLKKGEKLYAQNAFDYARKNQRDKKLSEESTFQYAKVSYDVGKSDIAISEFEKFLTSYPTSIHEVEVKEILAQAYVNGNDFSRAIQYIESLPRKNPAIDRAYQKATYLKGAELFNKEDYQQAALNFEKSLQYPVDQKYTILASFWCAEAYSISGKHNEAIKHYLTVVSAISSVEPEIALKTRYGLGYAYYNTKAYDRALFNYKEFVNKANKNTPNYTDGIIRLADCYYVTKSYDEALTQYARARNIGSPDNDYIILQSGVISGILRRYNDARTQLTSLISSYPKSQYRDEAMYQRAQFEIEQGNYQAAADGLSQLIREVPASPLLPYAYMRRAASFYNLKMYDRTVSDYIYVLKEFPTHPAAQQIMVPLQEVLSVTGRSGEFENYLAQFKRANPDNKGLESLEYETGKNFYFDQQYQKAITALNTFLTNYPQSARAAEANYYIAESYYRLRNFDKAMPIYQQLSTNMSFGLVTKVIARVAEIDFKQGRYQKANLSFHKLEKLAVNKKDLFNAWSGLMESFYLLGQYDSVTTYANLIIEKGNVNASAQNKATLFLGKAAMAKGDNDTAKDEFLNTLNTAQDEYGAEAKYLLARIFYLQKDYKQCYETLISLNRDFAAYEEWVGKSYLLLADNSYAMGDIFNAKATLQSLIDHFPLQTIKEEARVKLRAIEREQATKQQQMEADTLDN